MDASYKIWLRLAERFQRRRSLKMDDDDDERTAICEPNGSGELKIGIPLQTSVVLYIKVGFKGVYISRICFLDVKESPDAISVMIRMIK